MIGAEVVGIITSRTGQTLPRPTPDEIVAPFKQLQHVRVLTQLNPDLARKRWLRRTQHNMQIPQHDVGVVWLSAQEGALATYTPIVFDFLGGRVVHASSESSLEIKSCAHLSMLMSSLDKSIKRFRRRMPRSINTSSHTAKVLEPASMPLHDPISSPYPCATGPHF